MTDGRTDGLTVGRCDFNMPSEVPSGASKRFNFFFLNVDGGVNLDSSRCMHDPSFMALALIVSEKMT